MNIINEIGDLVEVEYFNQICSYLNFGEKYDIIYVQRWNDIKTELKKPTIMFLISDEQHSMPTKYLNHPNIIIIFKNYGLLNEVHPKVKPLPLGWVGGFNGTNEIPFMERTYDYSFCGAWNNNGREGLGIAFTKRQHDGKVKYFNMSRTWKGNLSVQDYASIMSNTKLSICPPGYVTTECFRINESAMCGNIIICDKPCNFFYNKNMPYFKPKSWQELDIIDDILSRPKKELENISKETYNWYLNNISPKKVAEYIENEMINIG